MLSSVSWIFTIAFVVVIVVEIIAVVVIITAFTVFIGVASFRARGDFRNFI